MAYTDKLNVVVFIGFGAVFVATVLLLAVADWICPSSGLFCTLAVPGRLNMD